jgi:heterodisulfide reductase subunit C
MRLDPFMVRNNGKHPDHAACSGCNLCLLVCPVWHQTRDVRLTPRGRAKAMQYGATADEMAASVAYCTLCGACAPVCPEGIDLVGMILDLRRSRPLARVQVAAKMSAAEGNAGKPAARTGTAPAQVPRTAPTLFLPGIVLRADPARLGRILALLEHRRKVAVANDDGSDIGLDLESGMRVSEERIARFLGGLQGAQELVVGEGILHAVLKRLLRGRLKGMRVVSLGEALSTLDAVRQKLRASDLYVIEPRAFHGDYDRLIGHYDRLRESRGCAMNLDLQRMAIPTTAAAAQNTLGLPGIDVAGQARWILDGREVSRIVVEDVLDCAAFASISDRPVVHLADL